MIAGLYIDSAARRTIVIRIRVRVEFIFVVDVWVPFLAVKPNYGSYREM